MITVISHSSASMRSAPGGMGYLAEMYEEARLVDELSAQQVEDQWLINSLSRLTHRYKGRLRSRWVNPYSLAGLYLAIRFRIRTYPTIIIGNEVLGPVATPAEFEDIVTARLSTESSRTNPEPKEAIHD